jgi:hypothetical protein
MGHGRSVGLRWKIVQFGPESEIASSAPYDLQLWWYLFPAEDNFATFGALLGSTRLVADVPAAVLEIRTPLTRKKVPTSCAYEWQVSLRFSRFWES